MGIPAGCSPALAALVRAYEDLKPASVPALVALYAPDATFRDPFNDVRGREAIRAVFDDMFHRAASPRFVVTGAVEQGASAFITWEFHLRLGTRRPRPVCVQGASQLHFDADGQVLSHRDYWDAAGELYVHLPGIGALMRWLRRRLAAPLSAVTARTPQPPLASPR